MTEFSPGPGFPVALQPWPGAPPGAGRSGLAACAAASRLLGRDTSLALAGGGNTSFKQGQTLFVKASGHSLATLDVDGFAALDRPSLQVLLEGDELGDISMMEALGTLQPQGTEPKVPSIEAWVHLAIPEASVLHTHADAIVTLTNTEGWRDHVTTALGDDIAMLDYCKPGHRLAMMVRDLVMGGELAGASGLVLRHHGLFTFAATAREAYERHVALVARAQRYIVERTGVAVGRSPGLDALVASATDAEAALVAELSEVAGEPRRAVVLEAESIRAFAAKADLAAVVRRGTATLEHVIYTKRGPSLGAERADLERFAEDYRDYFARWDPTVEENLRMLTPEPRVLIADGRLYGVGSDRGTALLTATIYLHTMGVIMAAEALGGYRPVSERDSFVIEYWELEQRKLRAKT
jgi:rhamnose utilization protein RhaD (predicted bifunctional aldolase and dehydrogenase)